MNEVAICRNLLSKNAQNRQAYFILNSLKFKLFLLNRRNVKSESDVVIEFLNFCSSIAEVFALLGYKDTSLGKYFPKFRYDMPISSSRIETSGKTFQTLV